MLSARHCLGTWNNANDAREGNFQKAIQACHEGREKLVCDILTLPNEVAASHREVPHPETLMAAGLRSHSNMPLETIIWRESTTAGFEYAQTTTGQAFYRYQLNPPAYSSDFCFGHVKVEKIVNFTRPDTASNGITISRVEHQIVVEGIAAQAHTPEVRSAFPEIARLADGVQTERLPLHQAGKGWQIPNSPDRAPARPL